MVEGNSLGTLGQLTLTVRGLGACSGLAQKAGKQELQVAVPTAPSNLGLQEQLYSKPVLSNPLYTQVHKNHANPMLVTKGSPHITLL